MALVSDVRVNRKYDPTISYRDAEYTACLWEKNVTPPPGPRIFPVRVTDHGCEADKQYHRQREKEEKKIHVECVEIC
jgi:hypothetical protein